MKRKPKDFFILEGKKLAAKKRIFLGRPQGRPQCCYLLSSAGFDMEEDISTRKEKIMRLANKKSKGLLTRRPVQHLEQNEKCTRYFFQKMAKSKHCMQSVLDLEGNEVSNIELILSVVRSFYSNLYQERLICNDKINFFSVSINC